MQVLTERQFDILNFHFKLDQWQFSSFENGYFTYRNRPWYFKSYGREWDDFVISLKFKTDEDYEMGPGFGLEEIAARTSRIYIEAPINWAERNAPAGLEEYWDLNYWKIFKERIRPYLGFRVFDLVDYRIASRPKQVSLGIAYEGSCPTLGQLVKLTTFCTKKEMYSAGNCGKKSINNFLQVFEDLGIDLDPKYYIDEKVGKEKTTA